MKKPLNICLWFDGQAKEAAEFYCSVFEDSSITSINPLVVTFEINGTRFMGLNGGPHFKFSEAVSIVVNCNTQDEIDHYWEKLISGGGSESKCGWLKDRFGLSWQILPANLDKLVSDPVKGSSVMKVLMEMTKPDISKLTNASV